MRWSERINTLYVAAGGACQRAQKAPWDVADCAINNDKDVFLFLNLTQPIVHRTNQHNSNVCDAFIMHFTSANNTYSSMYFSTTKTKQTYVLIDFIKNGIITEVKKVFDLF